MKYTEFQIDMLIGLYAISGGSTETWPLRKIANEYRINFKDSWLLEVQRDLVDQGYVRGQHDSLNDGIAALSLTGRGLTYVENITESGKFNEKLATFRLINHMNEEGLAESTENEDEIRVDSSTWTGIPSGISLSDDQRVRLIALVDEVEISLHGLEVGNFERAMAHAYIVAIRALAEAPEPPDELIWLLVDRANKLSGIAALFVSIIALFQVAAA